MIDTQQSFDELCRECGPRLLRYSARIVGDATIAEDIVQETFLRAWQRRNELDANRDPRPWLFTVARNLCFEALRARGRTIAMAEPPEQQRNDDDPIDQVEAAAERGFVREALASLPARQREMLLLKEVERVEYARLAEHLGVTEPTARVLLFRARRRLRERFAAASGAIAMAWATIVRVTTERARKAGDWVQTASLSGGALLNAAIGLAITGSMALPATAAIAQDGMPVARVTAVRSAGRPAMERAVPLKLATKIAKPAPMVRLDASEGAQVDAALPHSEAGDGRAWARTWRNHDAGRSALLTLVDDNCTDRCTPFQLDGGR